MRARAVRRGATARLALVALIVLIARGQPFAYAQRPEPEAAPEAAPDELEVDRVRSGAFVLVAGTVWMLSERVAQHYWPPTACHWICEDDGVNRLDTSARDALLWGEPERAALLSDLTGYVGVPLASFGLLAAGALWGEGASRGRILDDALILAEAVVVQGLVNRAFVFSFARARPMVQLAGRSPENGSDYMSFYSGHTSATFTMAVGAGTIATLRGYRVAPWIWAVGLPLAAATGALRMSADRHYLTDVTMGAAMGSAIGFIVPYLVHRRGGGVPSVDVSFAPMSGGGMVTVGGRL